MGKSTISMAMFNGYVNLPEGIWVCLKIVYPYTQWFCWSLSLWKMAISLGILTQHFQTNPYKMTISVRENGRGLHRFQEHAELQLGLALHWGKAAVVSLKANHQSTAVPSPNLGLKIIEKIMVKTHTFLIFLVEDIIPCHSLFWNGHCSWSMHNIHSIFHHVWTNLSWCTVPDDALCPDVAACVVLAITSCSGTCASGE